MYAVTCQDLHICVLQTSCKYGLHLTIDCFQALERIAGLLEGSSGSIVLSERGDSSSIDRHPDFRLLAAMNPATDAGLQFVLNRLACNYKRPKS